MEILGIYSNLFEKIAAALKDCSCAAERTFLSVLAVRLGWSYLIELEVAVETIALTELNRAIFVCLPHKWPARTPDLNPLDYLLWTHLKSRVYVDRPGNIEDLRARIRTEMRLISPETIGNVQRAFVEHLAHCQTVPYFISTPYNVGISASYIIITICFEAVLDHINANWYRKEKGKMVGTVAPKRPGFNPNGFLFLR
ncbi:hypothetical protein NQ318_022946 [Aromia moschata]|uniref:Tc1-like transposase DDE domain-containing protein n=1 Tax=Aromia moschata TaxID=1265417 RepID=A0AAV8X1R7_9CUCU|nr:hypothetical protein NQ318_022946 [Aromia moschata]